MEFQIRKIVYEGGSVKESDVMIEPISDVHAGARFHDKKKFAEVVKRINDDPRRYTFVMGDIFDATTLENKFFDPEACVDPELPTLEHQYQYILNILAPLARKGKILGVHCGNHDERLRIRHFQDFVLRLVDELNVVAAAANAPAIKYLKYTGITRLVFYEKFQTGKLMNRGSFNFYTAHGSYSGRRAGGNLNSVQDMERDYSADVYLSGHTHQLFIGKSEKIGMDQFAHLKKVVKIFGEIGRAHV